MSKVYNMAFAGFRHGHIYGLLNLAKESERVNITGGWEDFEADKKTAIENHGVDFCYDTYEDILNDSAVDIVAIGNYYQARGQMVIDALKAGKHVICDKPICISEEELEEIKKLQKATGLQVFAMLDMRFNENVNRAKKLIDDGMIGEVTNICLGGQHPLMYGSRACWYFEEGKHGGTITDIAVHGVDLLHYFTGSKIKEINGARCWNKFAKEVKHFRDSAMFMLTLENGAGVMADVSYAVPDTIGFSIPYYWDFKIWGTEGVMAFSFSSDGIDLYKNGNTEVVKVEKLPLEITYLEDFLNAIENKETKYLTTEASLLAMEQTLKIQQKADE